MLLEFGLFLMDDSEYHLVASIMCYIVLIDLAAFYNRMSACVIIRGCILPGLGLFLMVDSEFVAACCQGLDFF